MSASTVQSLEFSDAKMHHGSFEEANSAGERQENSAKGRLLDPEQLVRGMSVDQVAAWTRGEEVGKVRKASMDGKMKSFRVYSDGTADLRSITGDDGPRRSPSSVVQIGARDVGVRYHRKLRRLNLKSRRANTVGHLPATEATRLIPMEVDEEENGTERTKMEEDTEEEAKPSVCAALCDIFFGSIISVLLLFIPFAWASAHYGWSPAAIFWLNFLAMVPLAAILGDFTEEVAAHTNQVVGGLINATFGNAVEVVVAIQALLANEIRVVQASMIGSIFSNLLLVLGCCFFFGGLKYKEQSFNSTAATANMSLLALSSIALVLPTPFANYYEVQDEDVLAISRVAACFLIFMYLQLLVFQLRTHADLFEDEEDEEPDMPLWVALGGLVFVTLVIAKLSDYLVASIDGFCEHSGVSRTFVGLIILPIVGNAVEHMTAVSVAMKNKMDLAMGVAVGSCTQISLFVIPVTVIVGWACGKNMTLNFPHFEITLFVLSVVIVSICISNPRSNWLEGSLLITTYLMIAVGFWFEKLVSYQTSDDAAEGGGTEL